MVLPTFFDAGTCTAGTGSTMNVPFPATVAANDIAIWHVIVRQTGASANTFPGDWNEAFDAVNGFQTAWAWKRCDGTEGGTSPQVTGLAGGGIANYSRIYVFRGCVTSGTPFEASANTSGSSTTYSSSAINTLGVDRLALCLIIIGDDDKTLTNMTGSNVTWAKTVTECASGTGIDGTIVCEQANVAAATAVTAGSQTYSGSEIWGTNTFALIPAVTYQPRYGYVNHQNPGVF